MTIKPSEFHREVDAVESDAAFRLCEAKRLSNWICDVMEHGRKMRDAADAHGLPPDAAEQLAAFRKMLEEGPPDGSPLGGDAAQVEPKPTTQRRERQACAGCGLKRGHKQDCSTLKPSDEKILSGTPLQAAFETGLTVEEVNRQRSAIAERNEEARHEGDAQTKLAGRIRVCLEKDPALLPSQIAAAMNESLEKVRGAWPLLTGEKAP